jgi:hypothetical protein
VLKLTIHGLSSLRSRPDAMRRYELAQIINDEAEQAADGIEQIFRDEAPKASGQFVEGISPRRSRRQSVSWSRCVPISRTLPEVLLELRGPVGGRQRRFGREQNPTLKASGPMPQTSDWRTCRR